MDSHKQSDVVKLILSFGYLNDSIIEKIKENKTDDGGSSIMNKLVGVNLSRMAASHALEKARGQISKIDDKEGLSEQSDELNFGDDFLTSRSNL